MSDEWKLKELVDRKEAFVCANCVKCFLKLWHKPVLMRSAKTHYDVELCHDCKQALLDEGAVEFIPGLFYDQTEHDAKAS